MPREAFKEKKASAFLFPADDLVLITDPAHGLYDVRATQKPDKDLVASVAKYGVRQTVLICKLPEHEDRGVVVDGRRRVIAAKEVQRLLRAAAEMDGRDPATATQVMVPCLYTGKIAANDMGMSELVASSLTLNRMRKDEDPVSEAMRMKNLLDLSQGDVAEVARSTGYNQQTVRKRLKLLDLEREVRAAVMAGALAPTAACELHGLSREEQLSFIANLDEVGDEGGNGDASKPSARQIREQKGATPVPKKRVLREAIEDMTATLQEKGAYLEIKPESLNLDYVLERRGKMSQEMLSGIVIGMRISRGV